jgi:LysR family transcriptional regulator, regulator for bpeEF and oprC
MDPLFSGVLPFVIVAEERSFRRAAEKLGVTVAATSKAVRQLETALGVRLLERTSRSVRLTREGEVFFGRARDAVALVRSARELARDSQLEPRGPFTLSLPVILSRRVMPACARLAQRYPALTIHLRFTDQRVRFAEDSVEAAIRVGPLDDMNVVAQLLFPARWVTAASPAYLARHGAPRHPSDLQNHRCLKFVTHRGMVEDWTFREKLDQTTGHGTSMPGVLDSNYGEALLDAAIAGLGLTQVFDFMAADALRDGRLIEVLSDWSCVASQVHLVYPTSRRMSPRVRAVIEPLKEELRRDADLAAPR